jgi:hypothetical protein
MADNIDPAFLRARAGYYRQQASEATDPDQGSLFKRLAEAFDNSAGTRELSLGNRLERKP